MATLAVQITDAGASGPSYADILAQLRIIYFAIYGSDAVLDDDSQDGQFLAALSQALFDNCQGTIDAFSSFSPDKARGAQLSSLVKINGIRRLVSSNSEVPLVLSGDVGAQIVNGVVGDNAGLGTRWDLPTLSIIGSDGTVTVTATCETPGDIVAGHGTLTVILTPTRGWQAVTNDVNDTAPGQPVESDAELRSRQSNSVALPSQSILDGIYASVAAVNGVQRLEVYENDDDVADADGIPAHSIAVVVSGGDVGEVARAVALKKPPGTGTYGTTSQIVPDSRGVPRTIKFFELTTVPLRVQISIRPLVGYVSTTGDTLMQNVADFENALFIGEDSYTNRMYSPANLGGVGLGATFVVTDIKQARDADPVTGADVVIAFNEGATLSLDDMTLVIV